MKMIRNTTLCAALALPACSPPSTEQSRGSAGQLSAATAQGSVPSSSQVPVDDTIHPALQLAHKSGCMACHSVDQKVVGPAWRTVAERYASDETAPEHLFNKVKNGGKGAWIELTGGVPMPAYSPRVKDEEIRQLVAFVLSLVPEEQAE